MRPVRHVLVRAVLALLAILTTVAPAAAAVSEGVLATRAGRSPVTVHVEDGRRAQCPYVHADDCLLCATIGAHAIPAAALRPVDVPAVVACAVAAIPDAATWPAPGSLSTRQARGPPTG